MADIYHLAARRQWEAARPTGEYRISTRGVTLDEQGFIHCSLRDQVRGVADALFAGADDLVLLVIDEERVTVPIRYEAPEPDSDERYPHLYGPLDVDAVREVVPVGRDDAGRLILPW